MKILRLLPRFREVEKTVEKLNKARDWPRQKIEAIQLLQLNRVWSQAIQSTEYYRNLKADYRLPDQFDSLEEFQNKVPILNKEKVRDQPESFLSSKSTGGRWHRTGGSTGKPTSVFWAKDAHLRNLRLRYAWLSAHGVDYLAPNAMLWGHAASVAPGPKGHFAKLRRPIEDRLRNRQRFSAYHLTDETFERYLNCLCKRKTEMLYGYSSAILMLARFAATTDRAADLSLKLVVLTGEPTSPADSEFISRTLGCPAKIEYGSTECGNLAYEYQNGILEVQDSLRIIETLPRNTAEMSAPAFDIIVTVLDNPSFPLLRYTIGDTTSQPVERPEIGFSRLVDVTGRSNDYLVSGDGVFVHANVVKHVIECFPAIVRFQAHQHADGSIKVSYEQDKFSAPPDVVAIKSTLRRYLGDVLIQFVAVDRIKGNLAAKHRWVISDYHS